MRFNHLNFNTKHESSFYFLGWEEIIEKSFGNTKLYRNFVV